MPQLKEEYSPKTILACKIISYKRQQLPPPYATEAQERSLVFIICFSICTVETMLEKVKLQFAD